MHVVENARYADEVSSKIKRHQIFLCIATRDTHAITMAPFYEV